MREKFICWVLNKSYPIEHSARIGRNRTFGLEDYYLFWHFFKTIVADLALVVAEARFFLVSTRILRAPFVQKACVHHKIRRILEQLENETVGELLSLRELDFRHEFSVFFFDKIS